MEQDRIYCMYFQQRICDNNCAGFTESLDGRQVTCARCRSFINVGMRNVDWVELERSLNERLSSKDVIKNCFENEDEKVTAERNVRSLMKLVKYNDR